jgi:hypothetical protein
MRLVHNLMVNSMSALRGFAIGTGVALASSVLFGALTQQSQPAFAGMTETTVAQMGLEGGVTVIAKTDRLTAAEIAEDANGGFEQAALGETAASACITHVELAGVGGAVLTLFDENGAVAYSGTLDANRTAFFADEPLPSVTVREHENATAEVELRVSGTQEPASTVTPEADQAPRRFAARI